ncbi:hypothetical protein ACH5RR_008342 [Cinchona calisaya]|uniref:FRIGIDA-like protein n=1 Tax=Cinchona calisaya TaxID=153742 RepID=A0ABD3AEY1_9GENT
MAQPAVTTTPTPPPIKAEPPSLQPQTTVPTQDPQSLQAPQSLSPPPLPLVPSFINSITQLRHLSAALSAFQRCYDDLQSHLNSINSAIDSQLPLQKSHLSSPPHEEKPPQSELESFCIMMSSRGLRKYMITNLSEPEKLREEVPKALKLCPNPAKLVLECSGRFFLQGSKAYTKDSPMIPGREASVLVLECFLLMKNEGGNDIVKIEMAVKEEAWVAAIAWRKRLINEGGLSKASEIDARGLLFFLGCFGIPGVFRIEDFRDLFCAGNVKEIAGVLKGSSVLVTKFSDIIGWMVKNKRAIDAVDIAYTFGFEDKFDPQAILTSFLRESKEFSNRNKRSSHGSLVSLNEANKKQLAAYRSVVKCLESHKIDPSKLLPGWQINDKIKSLEKDIADSDKKIREKTVQKRKADETESSKLKNLEVKRSRYTGQIDGERNVLDGVRGHINRYASPSLLHGAGVSLLPENVAGSLAGIRGGVLGAGVSGGIPAVATGVLRTGSYAGVHSGALADTQIVHYDGQPYGLRDDTVLGERLAAHTYAGQPSAYGLASLYRRPSPLLDSFPGLPSSLTEGVGHRSSASNLYQFADAVVETESHHGTGSSTAGAVPPVVPSHHSSYPY